MTNRLAIGVAIAGLFLGAVFLGLRLGDGAGDDDAVAVNPKRPAHPVPSSSDRFFASDQRLLNDGPRAIREKALDAATGKGQSGVPYFIELADGRYAFGRTDAFGNTRPLFTDGPVAHKVAWDDEALSRTKAVIDAPPEPPVAPVAKGRLERWNETVATFGLPRTRRGAGRAATYHRAAITSSSPGVSCRVATTGDSLIAQACASGGRAQAKKEMKKLVAAAKGAGGKFTCEGCHKDLDSCDLLDNARNDFSLLLVAAGAGARVD